jgi:outer membrane autotransporter protein
MPPEPPPSPAPSPPLDPIYRPEAGLYMMTPEIARQSSLFALGTFHERQGDQSLFAQAGTSDPAIWFRVFGEVLDQDWAGPLEPRFDGQIGALQAGFEVWKFQIFSGGTEHVGLFYTYESAGGDGHAFVLGQHDNVAGTLAMNTNSVAGYWTHVGEDASYVDAVVMGSFYGAHPFSPVDVGAHLEGDGVTGSLEGGYPFLITDTIALEIQGQIIVQGISLDSTADPFTTLEFHNDLGVSGRIGLQLRDNINVDQMLIQPRLIANFWHTFSGNDTVLFNTVNALSTPFEESVFQIGAGVTARLTNQFGTYAEFSYTTNLDGQYEEAITGTIGIRYSW